MPVSKAGVRLPASSLVSEDQHTCASICRLLGLPKAFIAFVCAKKRSQALLFVYCAIIRLFPCLLLLIHVREEEVQENANQSSQAHALQSEGPNA